MIDQIEHTLNIDIVYIYIYIYTCIYIYIYIYKVRSSYALCLEYFCNISSITIRVGVKYSTCTWYLYLSTYLSVLDVLEYLVYGNVKVLVLVLVLDQKVLGTWQVIFKYYLLKSVKVANYLNTLL